MVQIQGTARFTWGVPSGKRSRLVLLCYVTIAVMCSVVLLAVCSHFDCYVYLPGHLAIPEPADCNELHLQGTHQSLMEYQTQVSAYVSKQFDLPEIQDENSFIRSVKRLYNDKIPPILTKDTRQDRMYEKENRCKLRDYFATWPRDRPKGVIYIAVDRQNYFQLRQTLPALERYFLTNYPYPVLIFYDSGMLASMLAEINSWGAAPERLYFQKVNFTLPDYYTKLTLTVQTSDPQKRIFRKSKCFSKTNERLRSFTRFHTVGVFHEPVLRGVDYILRLEPGTVLLSDTNLDVFHYMKVKGSTYGYRYLMEKVECVESLQLASQYFAKAENINVPINLMPANIVYFTGFEVLDASFWMNSNLLKYLQFIDSILALYPLEWSTSHIRTLAMTLLPPGESRVEKIPFIYFDGLREANYFPFESVYRLWLKLKHVERDDLHQGLEYLYSSACVYIILAMILMSCIIIITVSLSKIKTYHATLIPWVGLRKPYKYHEHSV